MKHKIINIEKNSIAEELSIESGDFLIEVNGKKVKDVLEYLYIISSEYVEITIEKKSGELIIYEIEKIYDEKIGLIFDNPILDKPNSCKNKCVFCFVDQLPKGMRKSLYFKDDDSRLSFLHGNYITLTNLSEEDFQKIIDLHISPINISIHATDPEVRLNMIKNPKSVNLMQQLEKLVENGIKINGQIVLCPGFNDGDILVKSIEDLANLGNNFENLAIVPVGLSKHRQGLEKLTPVTKKKAIEVIDTVEKYQKKYLKNRGNSFVYLSDEFYIKANKDFLKFDQYNGFPQIENGVGLIVKLTHEVENYLLKSPKGEFCGKVTLITGVLFYDYLLEISKMIEEKYSKISINVIKIKNNFFGENITVAGLITGKDIMNQVSKEEIGDKIIIPDTMLKADEKIFLDDVKLSELKEFFNLDILVVDNTGKDLVEKIIK